MGKGLVDKAVSLTAPFSVIFFFSNFFYCLLSKMSGAMMKEVMKFKAIGERLVHNWGKSAAAYGATGVVVALYLMDWEAVSSKIPYYGSKFGEAKLDDKI